ncbi:MAG: LexA family transcriptional regulator [Chitinophagaceae bacterium]|nr:MAG: LexA family transcriptional regulator [Chitinophagaceae bacterium]
MDANDYFPPACPDIDLNEQLIRNKESTYYLRVHSDAMSGAGIRRGDVVIVDRSLAPESGKVVIAAVNGELLIRRLELQNRRARLVPASELSPLPLDNFSREMIWGVVTYVIHCV